MSDPIPNHKTPYYMLRKYHRSAKLKYETNKPDKILGDFPKESSGVKYKI